MVRGTFSPARAWRPAAVARLARTLGLAGKAIWRASRISACRRGLSSHEKAMPIISASVCGLAAATRQEVGASARQSRDEAPLRLIASVVCEGDCVQSVRWAAATRAAVHPSSVARRLEPERAKFCLRREAAAVIGQHNHQDPARAVGRARPNPSLNHRTPNGRLSWPRLRYAVHFLSPGQAILPPVSG